MNEVHILHGFDGMPPSVSEGATQLCDTCARMTQTETEIEFRKHLFLPKIYRTEWIASVVRI